MTVKSTEFLVSALNSTQILIYPIYKYKELLFPHRPPYMKPINVKQQFIHNYLQSSVPEFYSLHLFYEHLGNLSSIETVNRYLII